MTQVMISVGHLVMFQETHANAKPTGKAKKGKKNEGTCSVFDIPTSVDGASSWYSVEARRSLGMNLTKREWEDRGVTIVPNSTPDSRLEELRSEGLYFRERDMQRAPRPNPISGEVRVQKRGQELILTVGEVSAFAVGHIYVHSNVF